jgi:hypothetical protein
VLRPGGLYLVGLSLTRYGDDEVEEDLWEARRGRCLVRQLVQYMPPGTWAMCNESAAHARRFERVVSHLRIERPAGCEDRDHTYTLRCYDAAQWNRILRRSPFRRVATVDGFGRPVAVRVMPYAIDVLMCLPRQS